MIIALTYVRTNMPLKGKKEKAYILYWNFSEYRTYSKNIEKQNWNETYTSIGDRADPRAHKYVMKDEKTEEARSQYPNVVNLW